MSLRQSLEQERASFAWDAVKRAKDNGLGSSYGSLARSAPADVQINGLGQTLAFWRAKGLERGSPKKGGKNEHYRLLTDISEWLRRRLRLPEQQDLVEWIAKQANTNEYRRATTEAIALLAWIKRFAEADLGEEE